MSQQTYQGIEKKAYKLVITHCPPSINIDLELELTKLTTTALLVEIDECWIASQLEHCSTDIISKRIRQMMH